MTKTTRELLEESRNLRLSFKPDKEKVSLQTAPVGKDLPWLHGYYQVLAPVGYTVTDMIYHIYCDENPNRKWHGDPDITIILHGHNRGKGCGAPTLCHVLGFNPADLEDLPSHFGHSWKRFGYED